MSEQSRYNKSQELVAMKEDIAKRSQGIVLKRMMITVATVATGLAIGAFAGPLIMGTAAASMMTGASLAVLEGC